MRSIDFPEGVQKSIIQDFIIKLLKSKERLTNVVYNSILVINNRLTKFIYFILYKEALNVKDLAYIFLRIVVVDYGLLDKIILD